VSVRKSSVSSLRTNSFGELYKVQVEGGMDPGNSGGPVVDSSGDVVGVAVSKIVNSQLNFAVPGDFIKTVLNVRITAFGISQPYKMGADVKVPFGMDFLDPLGRIRKASLAYWTGDPGKPRQASATEPKPEAGDSAIQTVELVYRNGKVEGDFALPALPQGKVYWTRPIYVNGAGETRWVMASVYKALPLIERKPAFLALKHVKANRPLLINSSSQLRIVYSDGDEHNL